MSDDLKPADPIDPGTRIGHVHLKVADIDRALEFYCGVLGFELKQRWDDEAAFVSAGGYHHHIGLNTWQSKGGQPPPPGTTGPLSRSRSSTRPGATLADALRRVREAGIPLDGASDHGVSEALYLRDPDENGVELYWDRPEAEWPRDPDDPERVAMFTAPLDLARPARRARLAQLGVAGFGQFSRRNSCSRTPASAMSCGGSLASPASARSRADSSESSKSSRDLLRGDGLELGDQLGVLVEHLLLGGRELAHSVGTPSRSELAEDRRRVRSRAR